MDPIVLATIAANIEDDFYEYAEYPIGEEISFTFSVPGQEGTQTHTLSVVDVLEFQTEDVLRYPGQDNVPVTGPKAIAFKDEAGNLYVHFNGTGDGKWGYNAANYGGPPSEVQEDSLAFFERVVQENYEGQGMKGLYVSGHSQGGNTAQYVTINSKYSDYIDTCMSLDGPGVSRDAVDAAKNQYGEAYYERQRQKIHCVNGELDFVSPLGQVQIVPEDQVTFVANTGGHPHSVSGMMDGSNLNAIVPEGSAFRNLVVSFNEKVISGLPPEDQLRAAQLTMKFAEYLLGVSKNGPNLLPTLTQKDLEDFKELLFPLLMEYLAEHPEMVAPALESLGMSRDTAALVESFLLNFNQLPENQRMEILETLGECFVVTPEGNIELRADLWQLWDALILVGPAILETTAEDPSRIMAVLKEYGILDQIQNLISENPLLTAVLAALMVIFLDDILLFLGSNVLLMYLVEGVYALVEGLENLVQNIKTFVLNTLQSISDAIGDIKEYLRSVSPGGKYASANPHFNADPDLMRNYARRLGAVNQKLTYLDQDLNDLYLQVGLLDVLDILESNIITSYSINVKSAQTFLEAAANILEAADRKALGCMGG